jgi:hypothetical protein
MSSSFLPFFLSRKKNKKKTKTKTRKKKKKLKNGKNGAKRKGREGS